MIGEFDAEDEICLGFNSPLTIFYDDDDFHHCTTLPGCAQISY